MTTISLPVKEQQPISRADVPEIKRLMFLRGIVRRQRQGAEWVMVPHWANLARAAGITPAGIYAIRDGDSNPRVGTIGRIARALGVFSRDIIDEEN